MTTATEPTIQTGRDGPDAPFFIQDADQWVWGIVLLGRDYTDAEALQIAYRHFAEWLAIGSDEREDYEEVPGDLFPTLHDDPRTYVRRRWGFTYPTAQSQALALADTLKQFAHSTVGEKELDELENLLRVDQQTLWVKDDCDPRRPPSDIFERVTIVGQPFPQTCDVCGNTHPVADDGMWLDGKFRCSNCIESCVRCREPLTEDEKISFEGEIYDARCFRYLVEEGEIDESVWEVDEIMDRIGW
jgi:hypothetical protein